MKVSMTSKHSRRLVLGLALAAAAALPAVAFAKGGGHGTCGGHGGHGPHMSGHGGHRGPGPSVEHVERRVERLGLDDKALTAVYEILDRARVEQRSQRRELRAAHEQMRSLLEADRPDLAAVEKQTEKIGALETAAHKAALRTLISLRPHLTSEQWAELQPRKRRGGPPDGPPGQAS
jgi:Spy/CpxP family protein refolding chaperone